MGGTTGTIGRGARVGIVAALAASLLALGPLDAHADWPTVKVTSGGGVVHGITTFGDGTQSTGLPSQCTVNGPGDNIPISVDGWAPNFSYNTVITGFVGIVHITGGGISRCATGPVRTGSLNLSITGTGPTGSRISCASLQGGFTRVATVVTVEVAGQCTINDWATSDVNFVSVIQFTPFDPVGSGVDSTLNIERAYFDGPFVLVPLIEQ